jgi:hypothetical protein
MNAKMKKAKILAFVIMVYVSTKKEAINVFVVLDSVVMIAVKTSKNVYQNHARIMGHVLIKWPHIFVNVNLDLKVTTVPLTLTNVRPIPVRTKAFALT